MGYVFLADGFEESEALVPVDILRRGGIEVKTVSAGGERVTGSHGITVVCDITADKADKKGLSAVVLPGGMPGTLNLEKNGYVQDFIDFAVKNSLYIGAICAAPSILGHKGILDGKNAVCFPGFESALAGAVLSSAPVVRDGNIITACGAGAAFDFGFELLSALTGDSEKTEALKKSMLYAK